MIKALEKEERKEFVEPELINIVEASGVALASIQARYEIVEEKDAQINALQQQMRELQAVGG